LSLHFWVTVEECAVGRPVLSKHWVTLYGTSSCHGNDSPQLSVSATDRMGWNCKPVFWLLISPLDAVLSNCVLTSLEK
jgi:hypothetical protein